MTGKIFKQMSLVLNDITFIEKERRNTQGNGYNFRGIDDVFNAMHPIFAKHGVFCVPAVLDMVREERESRAGGQLIYTILTVKYTFYAEDGSFVEAVAKGEAFDSGDKSCNKAMSAAAKYAILQTFCVPTQEDKDTENSSPEVAPKNIVARSASLTPPSLPSADIGEYVVTVGKKYKGMMLKDIPVNEIQSYMAWLYAEEAKAGKPLSGGALEFVNMAERYLESDPGNG